MAIQSPQHQHPVPSITTNSLTSLLVACDHQVLILLFLNAEQLCALVHSMPLLPRNRFDCHSLHTVHSSNSSPSKSDSKLATSPLTSNCIFSLQLTVIIQYLYSAILNYRHSPPGSVSSIHISD